MIARWHQCGTMTSQMLARASFSAVGLTVFPFEFRPRTFTIGFYEKNHIRAYDFGVQFSFKLLELPTSELHFCLESLSWPLSRSLFTNGRIKLWTIQNYKTEIVFAGLKSIVDFPSSQIHKWEMFYGPRLFLVHNSFVFFFSYQFDVCLFQCMVFVFPFFFQLPYDYLVDRQCRSQSSQPSLHSPWSYHLLFYSYQFDVCLFSNVCQ